MHDDYQIGVYPRGGSGRNARWEWVVYDLDGITPLKKGETLGSSKSARSAANMAAIALYLELQSARGYKTEVPR